MATVASISFLQPIAGYREYEICDTTVLSPTMPFTQGVLSILLSSQARALKPVEKEHFLAFCRDIKKYYQASIGPDVTFREILDAEKLVLTAAWRDISAGEEQGIYAIADRLDLDEWI